MLRAEMDWPLRTILSSIGRSRRNHGVVRKESSFTLTLTVIFGGR